MQTRFYSAADLDIERLAYDVEGVFFAQGYKVQHFGNKTQMAVQLYMGSEIEALVGMRAALTLTLQNGPRGVLATVGEQQWADKAAAGAVGMFLLWPLMITAGIGALRQATLEGQVFSSLDTAALRQRADVQIGAVPVDLHFQQPPPQQGPQPWPHASQQPPAPLQCPSCQEMNEEGDLYCSHCGKSLTQPKKQCANCHADLKPNAAFCTKCGTTVAA